MPAPELASPPTLFRRTLAECRELYVSSGQLVAHEYPHLLAQGGEKFVNLMDDLHRALVLKVYFAVCEADSRWSKEERLLAEALFEHLWDKRLSGEELRTAAQRASHDAEKLKWYALIRPFDRIVPLRQHVGTLETLVTRLANLVARADGQLHTREAAVIKSIQEELQHHLRPIPIDEANEHEQSHAIANQAIDSLKKEARDVHSASQPDLGVKTNNPARQSSSEGRSGSPSLQAPPPTLDEALAELDSLIGLDPIKREVRTLINFIKLQQRRGEAGLPDTDISLHMVFTGNPGTGKTTVARIVGKIFRAMGILEKGHLVETDRSGLVAEYMGQTGPKTQAKINEALDGVLFIDEAYSLVFQEGQDAFGGEAVQALLKRAEDDRARLVVILAGYTEEMNRLLQSNPGLSSRFNRTLSFDDYSPLEMARIFAWMCDKSRYTLAPAARAKLMLGLTELHRRRDRHFGNGRAVRNLFEQAIRRMANRIANVRELSPEALMLLTADDVFIDGLPADVSLDADDERLRFQVACPNCGNLCKARGSFLGQKVRCPKCKNDFLADWGEPVPV